MEKYLTSEYLTIIISGITAIFSVVSTIYSKHAANSAKKLEIQQSYKESLLKVHYEEKLSVIKDFLAAAAIFILEPESDELYAKVLSKAGPAIYVSNNTSMEAIQNFLKYAKDLRTKKEHLVPATEYYVTMCEFMGQESQLLNTSSLPRKKKHNNS